eukprot:CAMPEP_0115865460 /NCGR_PEP_ID=MMETSP0287-20121206/19732_1 /TAXON_ID=412157 /ORGANISM="Chrysochromulina rotalis, Strain UIO044" /LENGTH=367 /DNA_ID=CAMNT_0003319971 /DNA_START=180 /DNA_END=1283 /DNA_ORIENTATION=+
MIVAPVVGAMTRDKVAGIETPWFALSLCLGAHTTSNQPQFVSFIDDTDVGDTDEADVAAADDSVPTFGSACPANLKPTAQEFLLSADLSWAPVGHNESLVVFRGDDDFITLSFALRDATNTVLLHLDGVQLGSYSDTSGAYAPRRRLLFGNLGQLAASQDTESTMLHRPASRRLLKGGGVAGAHLSHSAASSAHFGGARSGAALAGPRVTHTSVSRPWGAAAHPVPTHYGRTSRAAVMAGTFVVLIHHGHGGFGRYYDNPSCSDELRGCEVRTAETLTRDELDGAFQITPELAFPLVLTVSTCNVIRAREGPPSLFIALYSPTGGVPPRTWVDGMLAWIFLPLVGMCFCTKRLTWRLQGIDDGHYDA